MASVQTFYRVFGEQTGMSPSEYRINLQSEADGGVKTAPKKRKDNSQHHRRPTAED